MNITSPRRSFDRNRFRVPNHQKALLEHHFTPPGRIGNPGSTASALFCNYTEVVTLAHHLDDGQRFVGHAVLAAGKVPANSFFDRQETLLTASQATRHILVRIGHHLTSNTTDAEIVSFGAIDYTVVSKGLAVADPPGGGPVRRGVDLSRNVTNHASQTKVRAWLYNQAMFCATSFRCASACLSCAFARRSEP